MGTDEPKKKWIQPFVLDTDWVMGFELGYDLSYFQELGESSANIGVTVKHLEQKTADFIFRILILGYF